MAKLALAFVVVILLALSTGLTDTRIGQTPYEQASIATLSSADQAAFPAAGVGVAPALAQGTDLEAPPLALMVYLIIVLLGSALAIGLVRLRQLH